MPRARNGKSGGYGTRSVSRLGGWVRWIGCAAVWEAGRAVCGERHLRQTQAYSPTATEDDGVGRGDIHTYAIAKKNLPFWGHVLRPCLALAGVLAAPPHIW